jgi:hypothetical protein
MAKKISLESSFKLPRDNEEAKIILEFSESLQSDYIGADVMKRLLEVMAGGFFVTFCAEELGPVAVQILAKKLQEGVGEIDSLIKEAAGEKSPN